MRSKLALALLDPCTAGYRYYPLNTNNPKVRRRTNTRKVYKSLAQPRKLQVDRSADASFTNKFDASSIYDAPGTSVQRAHLGVHHYIRVVREWNAEHGLHCDPVSFRKSERLGICQHPLRCSCSWSHRGFHRYGFGNDGLTSTF